MVMSENKDIKSDEIDLVEVARKIWNGRKIIYKTVAFFVIIGFILAIGTPKKYQSEVTLLVESGNSSGMSGLLQQFGGLAGINLGSGSGKDALSPELYPEVIKSTPFVLEIMKQKITESKYDSTITVSQFLDRHTKSSVGNIIKGYTIGLPGKMIKWIKGKPKNHSTLTGNQYPLKLTQEEFELMSNLSNCITTKYKLSSGTLTINVEMQDPQVAALLADSVVKSLTRYITDYRTQKAKNELCFVQQRHAEAEANYISAQRALAAHKDQNKNVVFATARAEEDRLQSEYNLAYNVFNGLSQQLEQAKIKVQENTPVFKILEPAQIPLHKSKPQTNLIIIAMILLGTIVGIGIIFGKSAFASISLKK
jgi:uncharacterized protein involved in exopolysaccharide biosynthesis